MEDFLEVVIPLIARGAERSSDLVGVIDKNLVQGLGVVQTCIIQAQGSQSDDAGLLAALQAAAGSPRQGAIIDGE